jgi:hypothetical protein
MTMVIPSYLPGATTLFSPVGGEWLTNPVFTWTAVSNASWYQIYIRKDWNYYYSTWLQGTNWQASWDLSAEYGNYEWSVIAWNEDGLGPWVWTNFRAGPYPPGAAQNLHIENWNGKTWTFVWSQSIPAATDFYVSLWRYDELVFGQWTKETWVNSPVIQRSGRYYWEVLTWNPGGYGDWATGQPFTIYGF